MELGKSRTEQLEHLTKGDVVYIPTEQVPNEDPKPSRPYVVLWQAETNTYAVCPITKQSCREHKITLECRDFLGSGVLTYDPSYARPNFIYTLEQDETWEKIGTLTPQKMQEISNKIKEFADQPRVAAPQTKVFARPVKPRIR